MALLFHWLFFLLASTTAEQLLVLLGSNEVRDPFWPLVTKLAARGHNLTVLSSSQDHLLNSSNVSVFELKGIRKFREKETIIYRGFTNFIKAVKKVNKKYYDEFYNDTTIRRLQFEQPSFGVVLMDVFYDGFAFPFVYSFKAPIILLMNSLEVSCSTAHSQEFPNPQSFEPSVTISYLKLLPFAEELMKPVLAQSSIHMGKRIELLEEQAIALLHPNTPNISDIRRKVSLIFLYDDPLFSLPIALPLHVIAMTPKYVNKEGPLPKDIEEFIQSSKDDGFIFMNLGSFEESLELSIEARNAFLQAFTHLPQVVLWEYYFDISNHSSNVKVFRVLPHEDILGHSKLRLVITSGEYWIMKEALYNAVPLLGIPMTDKQQQNFNRVKGQGLAESLHVRYLSANTISQTITKLLRDSRLKEALTNYSTKCKNDSDQSLKRAIFWTEYVIEHKNWRCVRPSDHPHKFLQNSIWKPICFVILAIFLLLHSICAAQTVDFL